MASGDSADGSRRVPMRTMQSRLQQGQDVEAFRSFESAQARSSAHRRLDAMLHVERVPRQPVDQRFAVCSEGGAKQQQLRIAPGGYQPLMPGASYVTVTPLADVLGSQTQSWELGATMFTVFGVLALALAAIGLYSVIAYNVAQRTHELGVRSALGAQLGDLVRLVLTDGLRLALVGVVLGSIIAFIVGRWAQPLLFEQSARDPAVFAGVAVLLLAVAALACFIPARRAGRVDPMRALRSE